MPELRKLVPAYTLFRPTPVKAGRPEQAQRGSGNPRFMPELLMPELRKLVPAYTLFRPTPVEPQSLIYPQRKAAAANGEAKPFVA